MRESTGRHNPVGVAAVFFLGLTATAGIAVFPEIYTGDPSRRWLLTNMLLGASILLIAVLLGTYAQRLPLWLIPGSRIKIVQGQERGEYKGIFFPPAVGIIALISETVLLLLLDWPFAIPAAIGLVGMSLWYLYRANEILLDIGVEFLNPNHLLIGIVLAFGVAVELQVAVVLTYP